MRVNEVPRKYTYIGVAMGEDNLVWMDEVKETVEGFPIGISKSRKLRQSIITRLKEL